MRSFERQLNGLAIVNNNQYHEARRREQEEENARRLQLAEEMAAINPTLELGAVQVDL